MAFNELPTTSYLAAHTIHSPNLKEIDAKLFFVASAAWDAIGTDKEDDAVGKYSDLIDVVIAPLMPDLVNTLTGFQAELLGNCAIKDVFLPGDRAARQKELIMQMLVISRHILGLTEALKAQDDPTVIEHLPVNDEVVTSPRLDVFQDFA